MNNHVEWKWASVFIEVALRAVRRVHYEYGLWGVGPQWKMSRQLAKRINTGQGIELALETAVCAAITQEFVGSPAVAGLWSDEADGQPDDEVRYFMISRETKYESRPKKSVDIVVQKFVPKDDKPGGDLEPVSPRSFIEAKRARLWTADIATGKAKHQGDQIADVRSDVEKLRMEIDHRRDNNDPIMGHVLVWGAYGRELEYSDHPVTFFNKVGNVELHTLRWLPLQWEQPPRAELSNTSLEIPQVRAALWIALAQVK